ncbi:MAG: hypothetical protein HYY31_06395 [Chloroflexi bacterium]|nr:hypothetical protein [Chloroflexota bacterium]
MGIFLGAYLFYYPGSYEPPSTVRPSLEQIAVSTPPVRGVTLALPPRRGVLLVDLAHFNNFDEEEISTLLSRVADAGFSIKSLKDSRQLDKELEQTDTFLVILPEDAYTSGEATAVEEFVNKGGKLLLIGDPSRQSEVNSLAKSFGIVFQPGYLYNLVAHDFNFQNVFITQFLPDEVTEALNRVVLYMAGSIKTSGIPLALADSNTYSSVVERTEAFSPLVKGANGRVLAIADLTFMVPPNNAVWDNERLIANLTNFLTKSERVLFR